MKPPNDCYPDRLAGPGAAGCDCGSMATVHLPGAWTAEKTAAPAEAEFAGGDFAMAGARAYGRATRHGRAANTVTQSQVPQQRLIIRNADMTIVATDTEAALTQIAQMAMPGSGGCWVVSSNVYQSTETSKRATSRFASRPRGSRAYRRHRRAGRARGEPEHVGPGT